LSEKMGANEPVKWGVKNVAFIFGKYVLFILTLFLKDPSVAEARHTKLPYSLTKND